MIQRCYTVTKVVSYMPAVFVSPTELNTDFHVGKVTENGKILSVDKRDMAYPN